MTALHRHRRDVHERRGYKRKTEAIQAEQEIQAEAILPIQSALPIQGELGSDRPRKRSREEVMEQLEEKVIEELDEVTECNDEKNPKSREETNQKQINLGNNLIQ